MGKEIQCQEQQCKQIATKQIHVVLRSRPQVPIEVSKALGYVCEEHKHQTLNEFIPLKTWQNLVFTFLAQKKQPPVRCVSYLTIKPIKRFYESK